MASAEQYIATLIDIPRLIDICRSHDVAMIGVFGSVARGEAHAQSDIDLLVRFATPKSLIRVIELEQQLAALFGRNVDLLTEASISPYLHDPIFHDLKVLYEA